MLGAGLLFVLSQINDAGTFFWVILAYCLCFAPCIALTTSISMRHIASPEKDFPTIRVMGTIAWIDQLIVPTFRCDNDQRALDILSQCFTDRKVVGID